MPCSHLQATKPLENDMVANAMNAMKAMKAMKATKAMNAMKAKPSQDSILC
jgi:hypothetical protein